jgi:hypothetical protein
MSHFQRLGKTFIRSGRLPMCYFSGWVLLCLVPPMVCAGKVPGW